MNLADWGLSNHDKILAKESLKRPGRDELFNTLTLNTLSFG